MPVATTAASAARGADDAATAPLHSRPLLKDEWPPRGTALRGTTLGYHLQPSGPARFHADYGLSPHLYRTFRPFPVEIADGRHTLCPDWACEVREMQLTSSELEHIDNGGLLWYNLKCKVPSPVASLSSSHSASFA